MSEIQNRLIKTTQKPIQLVIGSDQQVGQNPLGTIQVRFKGQ